MYSLNLVDVEFEGRISSGNVFEKLYPFTYEFTSGKSYLLNGKAGGGGWALSWIVGGLLKPQKGYISVDGKQKSLNQREKIAWCIRESEIRRFGFAGQSVKYQIQTGLKRNKNPYLKTEAEFIERFALTPERYHRPMSKLSHEAWRASCAIGLASGKQIFCFPYLEADFINTYFELWLKQIIDLLRASGSIVLVPADLSGSSQNLCDLVAPVSI